MSGKRGRAVVVAIVAVACAGLVTGCLPSDDGGGGGDGGTGSGSGSGLGGLLGNAFGGGSSSGGGGGAEEQPSTSRAGQGPRLTALRG